MEKSLKRKNMDYKLDIIKKLIYELCKYNNAAGYDNKKEFFIKFDYIKTLDPKESFYTIRINRGLSSPKEVFNLTYELENDLKLKELISEILYSEYLLYTSYKCGNSGMISKYNITLKNDIIVEFDVRDANMFNIIKSIENNFNNNRVYVNDVTIKCNKDDIQKEKLIKIFNLFTNIFGELNSYNSNNNSVYNSTYSLKISNNYDNVKECFIYNFYIFKGNINIEPIFNLRASIKENKFIYSYILDLIKEYKTKEYFLYDMIKKDSLKDKYVLLLSNKCLLEFEISNEYDKYFYNGLFNNKESDIKVLKKEL